MNPEDSIFKENMFSLPNADYAYYGWKVALLEIETTLMKSHGTSLTEFREDFR